MKQNFKLHSLSAAIISSLIATPLWAQTDGDSTQLGVTEEVVVTGFRRSLADALSAKRNSSNITDGISAEDIGKSADQNIAEALQRVTGISITRNEGEGSTVVVRGTSANLNNVTLNGVTLTSTSGDIGDNQGNQAVDFSAFTSDILSQIEVVKTPSADHDEGSLGAAIILRSFKPLSSNNNRRIFEIQSRYNDFEDADGLGISDFTNDGDRRANISLSQKLFDDTFGISVVASTETNSGRTDQYFIQRYYAVNSAPLVLGNGNPAPTSFPLIGSLAGGPNVEVPLGFTNEDGDVDQLIRVHAPFEVEYEQSFLRTERNTLSTTLQFQPTDETDIQFDMTYTTLDRDRDRSRFANRPNGTFYGDGATYDSDTLTLTRWQREVSQVGQAQLNNPRFFRPQQQTDYTSESNFILGFDVEQVVGEFTFNFRGGRSKSVSGDDKFVTTTAQIENQARGGAAVHINSLNGADERPGFVHGFDCSIGSSSACPIFFDDSNVNRIRPGEPDRPGASLPVVDDPFEFNFGSVNVRDRSIEDVSENIFFDVDWDHEFGPITSLETGVKWSYRNKLQRQTNNNFTRFSFNDRSGNGGPDAQRVQISQDPSFLREGQSFIGGFGEELGLPRDAITDGSFLLNPDGIVAFLDTLPSGGPNNSPNLANLRDLENTVYGGYIKANFELFDSRLQGDIGVRYAHTDVDAFGGASINLNENDLAARPENVAFFTANPVAGLTAEEASLAYNGPDLAELNENPGPGERRNDPLTAVPVSGSHSYDNVLPSLNLNYSLTDDMILRFAASRTIARPPIDDTRSNFSLTERVFDATSLANGGNTQLNPFVSDNLDLSFEWYFTEGSLFSVALFNKDLSDFVRNTTELFHVRETRPIFYDTDGFALTDPTQFGAATGQSGFVASPASLFLSPSVDQAGCFPNRENDLSAPNGAMGCDDIEFRQPKNGQKGYVRGLEMAVQHNLDYLPGLLSGLGFTANYTYSDSETEAEFNDDGSVLFRAAPLPDTSLHTFNATVFYEKDGKLLRLAYNTRSDYLVTSAPVQGGYQHYAEGGDSLDLSGAWDISDNLTLNMQIVNLLDDVDRRYAVNEVDNDITQAQLDAGYTRLPAESLSLGDTETSRTQRLLNTGTIYRLGLRFNF